MDTLIDFETLRRLTQYESPAAIAKCLKRQGVPVLYGKNGVFTTLAAIENGLGIRVQSEALDKYDFDFDDSAKAQR